ncbi:MAG: Hint domain-containing protein [Rhodobacteraceae bacterium]|nr:Hint domain-containing protein [Paracoccaceae bacterium]
MENASLFVGQSYGTAGSPLYSRVTSVTTIDNGGTAAALDTNNSVSNDQFSTNIGAGTQTFTYDGLTVYNATITYADGTTATVTAVIAQSTTGELFLAPEIAPNPDTTAYEAKPIVSITLNSVNSSTNTNFAADRQVTGWDNGVVDGTSGNDLINSAYVEPIANGSDRIDNGDGLTGAATAWQDDVVLAGAGNDTVLSGLGNDTVDGGTGTDSIDGGDGNDSLFGGAGVFADTILGGNGNDTIDGGDGNDSLLGGAGVDSILGGLGDDYVDGGTEADYIDGGDGNDSLFGGAGTFNDTILGGAGNDTIDGGDGNDSLLGGDGTDSILGGAGNDFIDGGTGNDTLNGGLGTDTMTGGFGSDRFVGLGIGDVVDGSEDADNSDIDILDIFGSGWTKATTNFIFNDPSHESGTVQFLDGSGNVIGTMTFSNIETIIPCFTPGTLIETVAGPVAVEALATGDRVLTRDHGYQTIRWIGRRDLGPGDLLARPQLAPVRIDKGALGPDMPARAMMVSPQHRVLLTGARAELVSGEAEALAPALHLAGLPGIVQDCDCRGVSYIHILFDQHEIVLSDGIWTESFQPVAATLGGMESNARDELIALFPELGAAEGLRFPAARITLKRHETRAIFAA